MASTSSSNASKSLYRSLVRELNRNALKSRTHAERRASPIAVYLRDLYSRKPSPEDLEPVQLKAAPIALEGKEPLKQEARSKKRVQMENLEIFLRNKRVHEELLLRYNPSHGMTEEERIRATARRVGLDVPLTYDGSEDGSQSDKQQSGGENEQVKRPAPGPLKPPV